MLSNCGTGCKYDLEESIPWIIGKWENIQLSNSYEEWAVVNRHHFRGISFQLDSNGNQKTQELIELKCEKESIIYAPRVFGQNDDQAIRFELLEIDESRLVFENKTHDFPQTIAYKKLDENRMTAIISGSEDFNFKKIQFNFRRIE
jgi:hypothetical protein